MEGYQGFIRQIRSYQRTILPRIEFFLAAVKFAGLDSRDEAQLVCKRFFDRTKKLENAQDKLVKLDQHCLLF